MIQTYLKAITGILCIHMSLAYTQPKMVDEVVAVVGDKAILLSDIEDQYRQLIAQGMPATKNMKCLILEELLTQKLLINQAEIDSVEVTEPQVELQLEQRIRYFVNQIGSEEKLVAYFNKSILEIKEDLRDVIREQMLTESMQAEIIGSISATPGEVKEFYKNLPKDSIPYVDAAVELDQIVLFPETSEEAIFKVRERLLNIRKRILNGENFATLAVLYSQGPSATRGGDIGWVSKADLDPAYASTAFALKKDAISRIVESSFGYHIIQLLEKTEDRIHTRHILMKPDISIEAKEKAKKRLDSLSRLIRLDSLSFDLAAKMYSEDEDTRLNGGVLVNPLTNDTKFELDQFETRDYLVIKNLEVGELSKPYESMDKNGKVVLKVIRIRHRTKPHTANLKDDFNLLKQMTIMNKRQDIINDWVAEKVKTTYIRIDKKYHNCEFRQKIWLK